jgi:MarR family transcriptional regulator, lower aerobic nicotinate degradation pathway regulator
LTGSRQNESSTSLEDLYSKPGHLIRRCQQIAVAMFLEEAKGFDITPVQYAALVAIGRHPQIDATRLSHLIAFDRSTLGSVLERLEQKQLVARTSGEEDRRVKKLILTKAGTQLLLDVESAVEQAQVRILAPLKPEERRRFVSMLERIVQINNTHSRAPHKSVTLKSAPARKR